MSRSLVLYPLAREARTGKGARKSGGRKKGRKSQCGGLRSVVSLDRPSSEIMRKNGSAVPESPNGEGIEPQKMLLGDSQSQPDVPRGKYARFKSPLKASVLPAECT